MARLKKRYVSIHDLRVGDMAEHVCGTLDARPVVDMDIIKRFVWISILTPEPVGPLPLENYRYYRMVPDTN